MADPESNNEGNNLNGDDVTRQNDKLPPGEEPHTSKSLSPLTRQDIPVIVSAVMAAAFPNAKAPPTSQPSSSSGNGE